MPKKKKWVRLRYMVFKRDGKICALCNSVDRDLEVDHIKPVSKYPELEFDIENLQVLCKLCNLGKGDKFEDNWRKNQEHDKPEPLFEWEN